MNLSPKDRQDFIDFYNEHRSEVEKRAFSIEMLEIQSKHLRLIHLEMLDRIDQPGISKAEFQYWMEKIDQYHAQSAGLAALIETRVSEMKTIKEQIIAKAKEYGIDLAVNNSADNDFPEYIDFH